MLQLLALLFYSGRRHLFLGMDLVSMLTEISTSALEKQKKPLLHPNTSQCTSKISPIFHYRRNKNTFSQLKQLYFRLSVCWTKSYLSHTDFDYPWNQLFLWKFLLSKESEEPFSEHNGHASSPLQFSICLHISQFSGFIHSMCISLQSESSLLTNGTVHSALPSFFLGSMLTWSLTFHVRVLCLTF